MALMESVKKSLAGAFNSQSAKVLILSVVLALSGCDQLDTPKNAQGSGALDRAQSYLDQGQYRAASIEARKALQEDGSNVEAHILLSRILMDVGQGKSAIIQLEQLSPAESKPAIYYLTLAEAYISRHKYYSAAEILEQHQFTTNEDKFKYHIHLSKVKSGLGEFKAAKEQLNKAQQYAGDDVENKQRILIDAASLSQRTDGKEVATYLDQAIALGNHPEALIAKASYEFQNENFEKAEDLLSNSLLELKTTDILTPMRAKVLQGLIKTLTRSGRSSEALIYSKLLAEATPNAEDNQNKFTEAMKLYQEGKLEEAEQLLSDMHSQSGGNELSGRLLGLINALQGDFYEADSFLTDNIDPETASSKALRVLVETKLRLNQNEEVLKILETKLQRSPEDVEILSIYGLALLTTGQVDQAVKHIEKAISLDPSKQKLKVRLADIYQRQGKKDEALKLLTNVYEQDKANENAIVALGKLYLRMDNPKAALALSKDQLKRAPKDLFSHSFAGSIAFAVKDFPAAIGHYQQALRIDDEDLPSHFGLANAHINQKDFDAAIQRSKLLIDKAPNIPQVYKILITASELSDRKDQAIDLMVSKNDQDIQAWAPATVLAEYYLRNGDSKKAVEYADEALSRNALVAYSQRVALLVYFQSANQFMAKQQYNQARELLIKGLQLKPEDIRYLSALTALEIRSGQHREAEKLIAQLETTFPDSTISLELRGDLLLAQEKLEDSEQQFQKAWNRNKNDAIAVKLLKVRQRLNKNTNTFLDEWIVALPKSTRALTTKAIEAQKANNIRLASKLYNQILTIDERSLAALNNLAWLKFENDESDAIVLDEKGAKLYPNNAAMLDTYGWILYKNGDKQKAQEILKKAHELAPDNEEIKSHYQEANN